MNFIERLKLKLIANNWEEYGVLKTSQIMKERIENYVPPQRPTSLQGPVSFKHSGNSGDIIYALPYAKGVAKDNGLNLFLQLNQPVTFSDKFKHPLGRVMLNEKMVNMLRPLFLAQEGILQCEPYDRQHIDIDLDLVRSAPLPVTKICLPRWYFLVFGETYDLSSPWIVAEPEPGVSDCIVIARSSRYQGHKIDYSFLRKYPRIQFLGVEDEFKEMKGFIPNMEYRPVKDFLEMACIIAGCKLFIGNQSFPFAIAEGLKSRRLLEVSGICPDVSVNGDNGQQFLFQDNFERLVKEMYE